MKTILAIFVALSVTPVVAEPQNAERATFQPLSIPVATDAPLSVADIAASLRNDGPVSPAEPKQVDRNNDGEISFTELLMQNIVSDF